MEIKILEIERKVDCLYDLMHKIYNSRSTSRLIINADSEQLYNSDVLNNDNQTENPSRSEYYDLSIDLEGVKLDVVINQSKLSNSISINQKDTSQNTEAINQLRDQLSNMQSRIVALEAKLDNPLPKKLTTNENSPENNESKTASPPTQPPLNQLHNVEISIIKPLALGVSKTKTYENEDRRPKMGLRNYENEDPLRKRRPIFVFVLRKRRP
jgi:TolA-binding protein